MAHLPIRSGKPERNVIMEARMQITFWAGFIASFVGLAGVASANSEIEKAFVPEGLIASHKIEATSCAKPRSFRRIILKGGTKFAREGEVFAFEPRIIRAQRCEEVEIVFENTDAVRHALMLPGLNPMFNLEFTGPRTESLRFVTPDEDVSLEFHCHVPTHENMGMFGTLIVGVGGSVVHDEAPKVAVATLFYGEGTVVAVDYRSSRLVLNHSEIEDFMAAMNEMSFLVSPPALLTKIKKGDKVRFTIDANKRIIVDVSKLN